MNPTKPYNKPLTQRLQLPSGIQTAPPKHPTPNNHQPNAERRDSYSVVAGEAEFFLDPLVRRPKIIVVGINRSDNNFVRNVEDYGFEAIHLEGDPNVKFPDADAAVYVSSNASHGSFYGIKDWAKAKANRKLFMSKNGGWTEVKADFEHYFFQYIRDLESLDLTITTKLHFLLAYYLRIPGTKFTILDFSNFINSLLTESISQTNITQFVMRSVESCFVFREAKGKYRWMGFTPTLAKQFKESKAPGVPIPEEWICGVETIVTTNLPVKVANLEPIPADEPVITKELIDRMAREATPATPQSPPQGSITSVNGVPVSDNKPSKLSTHEQFELMLMQMSEMQAAMANAGVDITTAPQLISKIQAKLPELSRAKLKAILDLIS